MRGSYTQHYLRTARTSDAVERAREIHKEECEQRLAKRMNTPKEKINTPWDEKEAK